MAKRYFPFITLIIIGLIIAYFLIVGKVSSVKSKPSLLDEQGVIQLWSQTLPDTTGLMYDLSQWHGFPLVVNFWASWCTPCVEEMADLNALKKAYSNVKFVGIGIDSADNLRKWIEKIQVTYPLLIMDENGPDLLRRLGNRHANLPFTIVFNPNGHINRKILGRIDADDLAQTLSEMVSKSQ